MWWEVVTELAYKMALDCGQVRDFFDMVDELSKHNGSHQKISSQSAMSTLLGHDWRNHRKRGRDPIRRISYFNGMLDAPNDDTKERPESVLVKRSKPSQVEPVLGMMSILKSTPVDISDRQSMSQRSSSISPIKTTEKLLPRGSLPKESPCLSQPKATTVASQQKSASSLQKISSQTDVNRSPPLRFKSAERKPISTRLSDSSRDDHMQSTRDDNKKPLSSGTSRSGKPGMAEKKQKPKKRRSSTKSTTKEYVVNRLKSVKAKDDGELVYLVEWQGDWDDTWEPYHFVAHLEDDIEQVYQNASPDVQAAMRMAGHIEPVD